MKLNNANSQNTLKYQVIKNQVLPSLNRIRSLAVVFINQESLRRTPENIHITNISVNIKKVAYSFRYLSYLFNFLAPRIPLRTPAEVFRIFTMNNSRRFLNAMNIYFGINMYVNNVASPKTKIILRFTIYFFPLHVAGCKYEHTNI